ncbi:MAG: alginate export family protein [Candidatus Kapabacteria bacterium]|nr:alginate export family protein [Candidatus Kapabacteria bacterium]
MKKILITLTMLLLGVMQLYSQVDSLTMGLDFRTRAENDNGQFTLIPEGKVDKTTVFSRSRLNIDYFYQNLELFLSIQDIRNWGEFNSISPKNPNFLLNEAWAKYNFSPEVAIKIGRQVLSYDDERLFGGLDWAMQGRSFEGIKGIVNFDNFSKLEAVITYNNDNITTNNLPNQEIYDITEAGEKTKSMQLLYYQMKNPDFIKFSVIALNSVLQNSTTGDHLNLQTLGSNLEQYFDNFGFFGSAYFQTGKNTRGQNKSAYQFSLNADFKITKQFNVVVGTEWLSGNNFNTDSSETKAFSPFYGTNHKFNGYMDYFFVGNHFNTVGLNDYYLKTTTKFSPNTILVVNLHTFTSNGTLSNNLSSFLGTEADVVFTHKFSKQFTLFLGHSFMFATESMNAIKAVSNPKNIQTWSWIGLNFTTNFKVI